MYKKKIRSQKKPVHKIQGDVSIIFFHSWKFVWLVVYMFSQRSASITVNIQKLLFGEKSPDAVVFPQIVPLVLYNVMLMK